MIFEQKNLDLLQKYYKDKNVLVTGGAGFVGSHVSEKLIELGAQVTIFDNLMRAEESTRNLNSLWEKNMVFSFIKGDVCNLEMIQKVVEKNDLVFHFAALPSHRLALKEPRAYADVDIMGTVNILESARLSKNMPKILFASSNKVYGKQQPPFKEDALLKPEGPYGQAKLSAEQWCMQYNKYYGVPVVINRLHHIIGPRSQPDLALSIFAEQVLNNKSPFVHGKVSGKKFDSCAAAFTNIYDAVEGILLSMALVENFDILNIGASKETTVLELAESIIDSLESKLKPKKVQMHEHESLHHAADPTKAKEVLGWEANTPIKVSVDQYIVWRNEVGERKAARYKDND